MVEIILLNKILMRKLVILLFSLQPQKSELVIMKNGAL